jgi:hypothetical protein
MRQLGRRQRVSVDLGGRRRVVLVRSAVGGGRLSDVAGSRQAVSSSSTSALTSAATVVSWCSAARWLGVGAC